MTKNVVHLSMDVPLGSCELRIRGLLPVLKTPTDQAVLLLSPQDCTRESVYQTTGCRYRSRQQGASCRSSALIGLVDDVDCAVVSLTYTGDPASPLQLQHVASIPALAYVATGMPYMAELPVGCIFDI